MNDKPIERAQQIVFAVTEPAIPSDVPTVILGIPEAAWEYMKQGRCHTFDMTKANVPVKILIFGAENNEEAYAQIADAARASGNPLNDQRRKDFGIEIPKEN